jgi:eukaryotic-like serine/threonine-protein kinase
MASSAGQRNVFRFGLFEADPVSGELLRQGERVHLQDQPFRMLVLLLERSGGVITRDELREKLWVDNTFVEFNNGLNVAVKKIRDALGDDADNPRFIETLPRRGYRFIAPVSVTKPDEASSIDHSALIPELLPSEPDVVFPRRRWQYYLVGAVLAVVAVAALVAVRRISLSKPSSQGTTASPRVEASPRRSVAVMEFQNVSGRPETRWLSTAIPEMLSTELAAGDKLRLISGEDVARVKRELHLQDAGSLARDAAVGVGRDLRVDVLVVGSYTAMGSAAHRRLRLDVRLQDASNGEIVAELAETGTEQHLFELVSQEGKSVREHLGVTGISISEEAEVRATLPTNREAARLYAEGLARLRVLDAVSARDLLEQAVAAESGFPLSHMALASSWKLLGYDQKARAEAKMAFDLSSTLPRTARLLIEGRYHEMSGEVDKAVAAYRALFALSPDSLEAGLLLAGMSKPSEARATLDSLRRLPEPLSSDPRIDMQEARLHGDFHEYLALVRQAAEKAKQQGAPVLQARARALECNGLHSLGQPEEAMQVCQAALRVFSENGNPSEIAQTLRFLGDIRQHQGRLAEAVDLHTQALKINQDSGDDKGRAVSFNELAIDYEAQGDWHQTERLYRQSYALFVQVGNLTNAAVLASNLGGTLLSEGKLAVADTWFQKSLKLAREAGSQGAEDAAIGNLAELAFFRGHLDSARQRAEDWVQRKRQSGDSFYLVFGLNQLAEILAAQADLAGARQNATEALTIAEKTGARFEAAQSHLALAVLDLEEGQATQAEPVIRDALALFRGEKMHDDELQALLALARCLLMQGRMVDAQAAIKQAREVSVSNQSPANHLLLVIADARTKTARSNDELRKSISTAHKLDFALLEYEARLALGEILIKNDPAGKESTNSLERDAHTRGFELIARKAGALRRNR